MEEARDNSSLAVGKSQKKEGGYFGSTKRHKESLLCYIDGHLSPQKKKKRSWNHYYRSTEAESCSRENIVQDDSGAYAVFTEQGSFASQMTATKTDVVARLPGCDGQAADAVSLYTQVKLEDATDCSKFVKTECPDV